MVCPAIVLLRPAADKQNQALTAGGIRVSVLPRSPGHRRIRHLLFGLDARPALGLSGHGYCHCPPQDSAVGRAPRRPNACTEVPAEDRLPGLNMLQSFVRLLAALQPEIVGGVIVTKRLVVQAAMGRCRCGQVTAIAQHGRAGI